MPASQVRHRGPADRLTSIRGIENPIYEPSYAHSLGVNRARTMTNEDHRISPRRRVLKSGTIEFSGSALPCTVRNLSETGAAIEINSPLWFPERFTLVIDSEQLRKPCQIAWRKERRVGVIFVVT